MPKLKNWLALEKFNRLHTHCLDFLRHSQHGSVVRSIARKTCGAQACSARYASTYPAHELVSRRLLGDGTQFVVEVLQLLLELLLLGLRLIFFLLGLTSRANVVLNELG